MKDLLQYILIGFITLIPILMWGYVFSIQGANISRKNIQTFFVAGIFSAVIIAGLQVVGRKWWYDIFNYDSKNLSNVRGKWNVGAYPRSVSFSYDDSMLATSNYTSLIVYDTTTYEED